MKKSEPKLILNLQVESEELEQKVKLAMNKYIEDVIVGNLDDEIDKIVCIGPQAYDIATRLKYADIDESHIVVIPLIDEACKFIKAKTKGNIYGILNFDMVEPFNTNMKGENNGN